MSRFFSRRFAGMAPYVPGEQPQDMAYIKLNTNESPFPPSPAVTAAVSPKEVEKLNLYSDPDTVRACEAIASYYGLTRENVMLGNGSDELLAFAFQAFCDGDVPVRYPEFSYGFYKVFARVYCLEARPVPMDRSLQLDPRDYHHDDATIFIANPNAPTGQCLSVGEVEGIAAANPHHVVVMDEAYIDFGGESALGLIRKYDNLLILRTMSKSRSLAGGRLGFAMGDAALIADLNTLKFSFNPYNINRLSLLAAEAAIKDEEYFKRCTAAIAKNRDYTVRELIKRGFDVLPSKANFVFADPVRLSGREYYRQLKEKGVLVRHFDHERLTNRVRISIGSMEQMNALLRATDEIWEEL